MSAWLHALHFLRPHWLWALLALPALWGLWQVRQRRGNVWRGVVDAHGPTRIALNPEIDEATLGRVDDDDVIGRAKLGGGHGSPRCWIVVVGGRSNGI